jgi:ABC-type protease/lipase transport system fused ATPase/permease subunit
VETEVVRIKGRRQDKGGEGGRSKSAGWEDQPPFPFHFLSIFNFHFLIFYFSIFFLLFLLASTCVSQSKTTKNFKKM